MTLFGQWWAKVLSVSMFHWLILAAVVAFAVLMLLTLRARRPLQLPPLKSKTAETDEAPSLWSRIKFLLNRFFHDIKTLFQQDDSIYRIPWVMMIGDKDAGKSSLASSLISSPRLRNLVEDPLDDPGRQGWWHFDKGMLVDVDSLIEQTSEKEFVAQLMRVRAERPLDGVLLCISAKELQKSTEREILDKAIAHHDQLSRFQQQFNFTFPVYVLVTKTDEIPGFTEFCRECSPEQLEEIFGWSNPNSLESGFSPESIVTAFEQIRDSLRALQLNVAMKGELDTDADRFFLFPRHLNTLKHALHKFTNQVFKVNAYQASFYFRGVYFSGVDLHRQVVPEKSPAPNVAFLDHLFADKIFAEQNIAKPIKGSIWSRQSQIRRLQKTLLATFTILFMGLGIATFGLDRKIDEMEAILAVIDFERRGNTQGAGCTDFATISRLLTYMGRVESGLASFWIPVSWFDQSLQDNISLSTSKSTFEDVIFRGIDCQIKEQENHLSQLQKIEQNTNIQALNELSAYSENYLNAVIRLHESMELWNQFVHISKLHKSKRFNVFDELLIHIYGKGTSKNIQRDRRAIADVLQHASIKPYQPMENTFAAISQNIDSLLIQLDDAAHLGLSNGIEMMPNIRDGYASAEDISRFSEWITWVDAEWLMTKDDQSECDDIVERLIDELRQIDGYDQFQGFTHKVENKFNRSYCRDTAESVLVGVRLEPLANMLVPEKDAEHQHVDFKLSSTWRSEAKLFHKLASQPFMQINGSASFTCDSGASRWDPASLQEARGYLLQLDAFIEESKALTVLDAAAQRKLSTSLNVHDRPSVQLAKQHTQRLMHLLFTEAQTNGANSVAPTLNKSSSSQLSLRRNSLAFSTVVNDMLDIFSLFERMGMSATAQPIAMCTQQFAHRQLQLIEHLANSSHLMKPKLISAENALEYQDLGTSPILRFGNTATVDNWWKLELIRTETILGYTQPYASLLNLLKKDYGSLGIASEQAMYWDNSYIELQNNVEFSRTDGQVTALKLLLTTLAGASDNNCTEALKALPETALGIDFFSERRQQVAAAFKAKCQGDIQTTAQARSSDLHQQFASISERFPFASGSETREASLASTRNFFLDYAAQADELRRALNKSGASVSVKNIFDMFDGSVQFFNSHLAVEGAPARLNFTVDFRSKESEGSHNLVNWQMSNGVETVARPQLENTDISWYYGEPIIFRFAWPVNSVLRPLQDNSQPHLTVTGHQAEFYFGGNYALQRLIASQIYSGTTIGSMKPEPLTLRFLVPVTTRNDASESLSPVQVVELFVRIDVTTVDAVGQSSPVFVPSQFPQQFPVLR